MSNDRLAEDQSFQEPTGEDIAGRRTYVRAQNAYERFMAEQEIPIYRARGIYDVRELPTAPWQRMGGRGTFIQLDGTERIWGMYLVEIPSAGALNAERHIYEELFYVVEGRGSTEVWREGSPKKQRFEWQAGSFFAVPLNTWHRLVNATSSPALVLAGTMAPPVMNIFDNQRFIFDNSFEFTERYDEADDYFKPKDELASDPIWGRAMRRTSLLPDVVNCELPLDNQRSPGYRRIEPHMASGNFFTFIGQYETGRYSKAHYHQSRAVLICLRGKGYTFNWPREIGTHPWESGKAEHVKRQDYIPGGMVSAAPGGGDWFHQHFGVAKEPLRLLVWAGGGHPGMQGGKPGEEVASGSLSLKEGGHSIDYPDEDPYIREEFERMLGQDGAESRMPERLYGIVQ